VIKLSRWCQENPVLSALVMLLGSPVLLPAAILLGLGFALREVAIDLGRRR
jgi:hypothetical protein